jgi:hypothetical protein
MLTQNHVTWKYVKTYATEAALMKKIAEVKDTFPEHDDRFIVMRTPDGRWTAVVILDMTKGGYLGRYDFLKVS